MQVYPPSLVNNDSRCDLSLSAAVRGVPAPTGTAPSRRSRRRGSRDDATTIPTKERAARKQDRTASKRPSSDARAVTGEPCRIRNVDIAHLQPPASRPRESPPGRATDPARAVHEHVPRPRLGLEVEYPLLAWEWAQFMLTWFTPSRKPWIPSASRRDRASCAAGTSRNLPIVSRSMPRILHSFYCQLANMLAR